eukprot:2801796-Prymnesium_polylepis.1
MDVMKSRLSASVELPRHWLARSMCVRGRSGQERWRVESEVAAEWVEVKRWNVGFTATDPLLSVGVQLLWGARARGQTRSDAGKTSFTADQWQE